MNPCRGNITLQEAGRQFWRLLSLIRPHWAELRRGLYLACTVALLCLVAPYVSKLLIDEAYPSEDLALAQVLVAGLLTINICKSLVHALGGTFDMAVNARVSNELGLLFFNHVQHLPLSFFDEHRTGELQSRFQDVKEAFTAVEKTVRTVFMQGLYVVLIPPVLLYLQWELALVAFIAVPVTAMLTTLAGRHLRTHWKQATEAYAELDAFRTEALANVRMFKTLALEPCLWEQARSCAVTAMAVRIRAGSFSWLISTGNWVVGDLNSALYVFLAWHFIIGGKMTLGAYIAFQAYVTLLQGPMARFIELYGEFQQSSVKLTRMFEYLDTPPEQDPALALPAAAGKPARAEAPALRGQFDLTGVTFRYGPASPVLEDATVSIKAGQVTALVGPSGSGKSTILQLLVRLRIPHAGHLTVDGIPIERLPLAALRRQVAYVQQDTQLVKGSLWKNLTLARPDATREDVEKAVALCQLGAFVDALPRGYDTPVSEWGASLSGGQRQRVVLVRAVLRDAPALLLDEATANIDGQTERALLHALFELYQGRTIVFVTHRMSAARLADRIVMVEQGKVAGAGTHGQLLEHCTPYRSLCKADASIGAGPSGDGAAHSNQEVLWLAMER